MTKAGSLFLPGSVRAAPAFLEIDFHRRPASLSRDQVSLGVAVAVFGSRPWPADRALLGERACGFPVSLK
jgi:hypothetical protein